MFEIDIDKETEIFRSRLLNGEFTLEESTNNEDDYLERKQERDLEAVKAFVKTSIFREIVKGVNKDADTE